MIRLGGHVFVVVAFVLAGCCPAPVAPAVTTLTSDPADDTAQRPAPPADPPADPPTDEPAPPTPPADEPPAAPVALDWNAAGIDWTKPPPAWPEAPFTPPAPVRFTLANGVTVYLVENHRLPLVSVRVLHGAAGSREDAGRAGLASLTAELLDQGAGSRTALELPEELERLGARLSMSAGGDHAILSLDTLADTLEPSLAIAADVVQRPRLDAADFDRVKAERLADLALRPDSPRAVAALVFEHATFGAHPYGAPGAGWVDTVEPLTLDDVKAFWSTHYGPGATTIVVAGDAARAQLEPMLARTWGAWKGKATARPRPRSPRPTKPILAFVDRPGAPQSVVTIGRVGPDVTDRNREPLDVITTAVGGSFAARLNTRLREQLGYTYSIYATVWRGQWSGAWTTSSSIRTDVTVPAIKEALKILAATAATPLPPDELSKAKGLITLALPQNFETNGAIAGAYANLVLERRPMTTYRDLPAAVAKVNARSARRAASLWKDFTIVIVGDYSLLSKDLPSLGLPIIRYTPDGRPM